MRRVVWLLSCAFLSLIAALGVGVGPDAGPATATEEVVLYTARHYGQEPAFEAFTKEAVASLNDDI